MLNLSIIVITKDDQEGIVRTLESLSGFFNRNDCEIIVCEGSNKRTSESILSKYNVSNSLYLEGPDKGIYSAMNRSMKRIKFDFIWFLNGGDVFSKNMKVDQLSNIMHKSRTLWFQFKQKQTGNSALKFINIRLMICRFLLEYGISPIPHQASIFNKKFFEKLDMYSEEIGLWADQEKYLKAFCYEIKPEKIFKYLSIHDPGGLGDSQPFGSFRNQVVNYKKAKGTNNNKLIKNVLAKSILYVQQKKNSNKFDAKF